MVIADVLLALNFASTKAYQKREGASNEKGLLFNALLGFFNALLFFAWNGFKCNITVFSAVMALIMGGLCVAYICLSFRIMENGSMTAYTVYLMTGGMAVPYIWGLLFLDEPFSPVRTAGLLIIAAAIVAMHSESGSPRGKTLLMCVLVFFLNGFVSVVSKEHQISRSAVSSLDFVILTGAARALLSSAALLFVKKKSVKMQINRNAVLFALLCAAFSGVSYFFQLTGAVSLPATVLYPFITGGSIIFTAVAALLFFGERPKKREAAGIILCFLGTLMFL